MGLDTSIYENENLIMAASTGLIQIKLLALPEMPSKQNLRAMAEALHKDMDNVIGRGLRERFMQNTNPQTGRIIKSNVISKSLNIKTQKEARSGSVFLEAKLDLPSRFDAWRAHIMERGGRIIPTGRMAGSTGKLLAIPTFRAFGKGKKAIAKPTPRMFPKAFWSASRVSGLPRLVIKANKKSPPFVLFTGHKSVKMPAKRYFAKSISQTEKDISKTFPKMVDLRFAQIFQPKGGQPVERFIKGAKFIGRV